MQDDYLFPFIIASTEIIEQITGLKLNAGTVCTKDGPYTNEGLMVLIGVTGGFHGNIVISFSQNICCQIASAMMGCELLTEIDEIAKSAIGELCNMILGTAATLLSKENVIIDITPPTFLMGSHVQLSTPNTLVCIPLQLENETKIEINISFAENS